MVKSKITESRLRDNSISYPCLKKSPRGDILLMQDANTGVVLASGDGVYPVGDFSIAWNPASLHALSPEEVVTITFSNGSSK